MKKRLINKVSKRLGCANKIISVKVQNSVRRFFPKKLLLNFNPINIIIIPLYNLTANFTRSSDSSPVRS